MEHHRLKPMGDYPKELFNTLYKQTTGLRRKLASQIDARKFGVDYFEILSWFDVKFIYLFNKYWQTHNDKLLGYIISGLTTYKRRITLNSYQERWADYANKLDIDDMWDNPIKDDDTDLPLKREFYMEKIHGFMKNTLSEDGYLIFNLQLVPPAFISERLKAMGNRTEKNIPPEFIAEYLNLDISKPSITYINGLKLEVKEATSKCAAFFKNNPVEYIES